jgi:hypothetical protein
LSLYHKQLCRFTWVCGDTNFAFENLQKKCQKKNRIVVDRRKRGTYNPDRFRGQRPDSESPTKCILSTHHYRQIESRVKPKNKIFLERNPTMKSQKQKPRYSAIRQPGKDRMPQWIWREPKRGLPLLAKQMLKLFWRFGPRGCDWWNCVLARYFKVSTRHIRRQLHLLKFYPLIAIAYPDGRNRVIRRLPYFTRSIWQQQRPLWLERLGRTKMSSLDNAQQKNNYTTSYSSSAAAAERLSPQQPSAEPPTAKETLTGGAHPPSPPWAVQGGDVAKKLKRRRESYETGIKQLEDQEIARQHPAEPP